MADFSHSDTGPFRSLRDKSTFISSIQSRGVLLPLEEVTINIAIRAGVLDENIIDRLERKEITLEEVMWYVKRFFPVQRFTPPLFGYNPATKRYGYVLVKQEPSWDIQRRCDDLKKGFTKSPAQ